MQEYRELIGDLRRQGGHFVKIMTSGIMDFTHGGLTEPSLADSEIRELIHIAHEEGFPSWHIQTAVRQSGQQLSQVWTVSNMENFCDEDALQALRSFRCCLGTYDSNSKKSSRRRTVSGTSSEKHLEGQKKALLRGYQLGAKLAFGSDAGAYRVLHGQGLLDEYQAFREILEEDFPDWEKRIRNGDWLIKERFS